MEVDERLRWLESRISSSLRPRGEELRSLFADEENRTAFLAFCNHSESRKLFVYLSSKDEGEGGITVSATPPRQLSDKALFFLKCSHASKLSRESIGHDVVYSECSTLPLEHLELVSREVYLPLISSHLPPHSGLSGDKLMDLMHRLVGAVQVTRGFCDGRVVLPLPSIEVLAEAAMNTDRKAAVIHVLESSVVSWMKQVKIAMLLDPSTTIIKAHGKYAGPLAEIEFWSKRLSRLESVRNQLNSVVVLNILHNLEQAHSTYAQAFIHVHRDIGKAIVDTEYYLMYLNTLQPWFLQLNQAFSSELLMKVFPPTIKTLLLVWQHSRFYSTGTHFHRILHLLANEVMLKARDIVGEDILDNPEMSLTHLKLALRVCASFRGCYLDYREKADAILRSLREKREQVNSEQEQHGSLPTFTISSVRGSQLHLPPQQPHPHSHAHPVPGSSSSIIGGPSSIAISGVGGGGGGGGIGGKGLCSWPARNSPVFAPLNAIMERCNDLLDLVQTVHDFRELNLAKVDTGSLSYRGNPLIMDIYNNFTTSMSAFQNEIQDLLSLEPDYSFEERFFHFRSSVKGFEKQLVGCLDQILDHTPSLPAKLRVVEMFQGIFKRDAIKTNLQPQLDDIVSQLISEVKSISSTLSSSPSSLLLPLTPPVASKLLWLNALKERVTAPMSRVREVAPYLLEGDQGWKLRQAYAQVTTKIDECASGSETSWIHSVPPGLAKRLKGNVLVRSSSGHLEVNVDPLLIEVLSEIHYLTRPPLSVRLPVSLRQLVKAIDFKQLKHRKTSLEVVVESYNELQDSLSEVERMLFQHKLQEAEKLISVGLENLDWTSPNFSDFVAKTRALICVELQSILLTVRQHTQAIGGIAESWGRASGVDMFDTEDGGKTKLTDLEQKHRHLLESLQHLLPSSLQKITNHINQTFVCVHEASQTSPSWTAYLQQIDSTLLAGLKHLLLTVLATLVQKATRYEQGAPISPLVMVQLELQGGDIQFSPPLSGHSAISSVPEVVQKWMNDYLSLTKLIPRVHLEGGSSGEDGEPKRRDAKTVSCFEAISSDPDIKGAIAKICAHLETNSRQCQSLRKRFSIYGFLWEQDVGATFAEFMQGQATPHPRRFTRPETVRSRASARVHSGRPKSSSQSQLLTPAPEQNLLGVMGVSDWDFLRPPPPVADPSTTPTGGGEPEGGGGGERDVGKEEREEDTAKRPSLDDFDGEIAVFQGVLDRLSSIEDVASVGWIQVDQRPAKQALTALAEKWKHIYASHLERQISYMLSNLERFFYEIEPEVEAISGEERDTQAFMKLMSIFNRVNSQQVEMDTKFGAVHRAVLMLDNFKCPLPPQLRAQFNNAPHRWSNLKKRVALGKQRIGPRIQAKGDIISQDLSSFGQTFSALREKFEASNCLQHHCPRQQALVLIGEFSKELKELQTQARDLIELQELLETSVFNFSLLKTFEDDLSTLQELWSISESITVKHGEWHRHRWSEIDTSELRSETDHQLYLLSTLPLAVVKEWDVYKHTVEMVHVVQTTAPMVEGLRSPSMRARHWKQVLRFAKGGSVHLLGRGGTFDPSVLEELTFGQLLDMGLHNHPAEVQSIVERADKDIAIESLLNTFEEVWLSRQLELRPHRRVTDRQETISELGIDSARQSSATPKSRVTSAVRRRGAYPLVGGYGSALSVGSPSRENVSTRSSVPLLQNTGGIFETLESHQMSLQSLEGTVAALSFTDDLQRWHKQLQTIEAVLSTWLKVQLLWVQLEEVYGSSEVQQHLPTHVYTFSNVDREWRELMKTTAKNPAVINVCLKEDLLLSLEKLHSSLVQCQSALVRYVEGQRSRCPWFYFLPLEDILQFVCYGSSLQQLSTHIPKLLHYASGLVFDNVPPAYAPPTHSSALPSSYSSERVTPHATPTVRGGATGSQVTAVVSTHGEKLNLNQSVLCEGPVEGIISQLISSLSSTLQAQLTNAVTSYVTPNSSQSEQQQAMQFSSLSSLSHIWKSSLVTQVIVLVTQIALEIGLSQVVQKQESEAEKMLEGFIKEVDSLTSLAVALIKGKILDGINDVTKPHPSNIGQPSISQDQQGTSAVIITGEGPTPIHEGQRSSSAYLVPKSQIQKMENIIVVLSSYRYKAKEIKSSLSTTSRNISNSFQWQSLLHYDWSMQDSVASITTVGASLSYGCHYTGSAGRLVLTPRTEKAVCYLLQAMKQGNSSLVLGKEELSCLSLVHELAVSAGQCLFSVQCSPQVSSDSILNCIKGIANTGSWLFLERVDCLQPAILQTACTLLAELKDAQTNRKSTVQVLGDTVHLSSPDNCGTCFASTSDNWCNFTSNSEEFSQLPVSLLETFKTCGVNLVDRKLILEAFFISQRFESAGYLAESLDKFCQALQELFLVDIASIFSQEPTEYCKNSSPSYLSLHQLKSIVALARTFMQEFEGIAIVSDEGMSPQHGPLHMASMVYSEISHSTLNSLKYKTPFIPSTGDASDTADQKAYQRQSLEEFSLVLSLKDSVLSAFSTTTNGRDYSMVVKLITEVFPSCDLEGLLSHEASVREGLAVQSKEDPSKGTESARESRAASAMQMVQDDHPPSEVEIGLEQQIVLSCQALQLVPTQLFQTAVAQLVALIQHHRFIAIYGPSCSGKSTVIQTAVETLRQQPAAAARGGGPTHIACTTIAVGAMREEQLLGHQQHGGDSLWQDGVLTSLLVKDNLHDPDSAIRGSAHWFVLEGGLSTSQLDSLLSCAISSPKAALTLSNGRTTQLSDATRFILELEDLSCLNPSSITEIGKVYVSSDTISWKDILLTWLTSQSQLQTEHTQALFDKYIPDVLEFLRPILATGGGFAQKSEPGHETQSVVSLSERVTQSQAEPQEVMFSEVHLIKTCYHILESLFESESADQDNSSSPPCLEHHLIYSIVWAFGGFLSQRNKVTFDLWWRTTFNQSNPELCFPEPGLIWDYYTRSGVQGFLAWRENLPKYTITKKDSSISDFVPNVRAVAVQSLVERLISRGKSVLLTGPHGSGKTSLLQDLLNARRNSKNNDAALLHIYTNHLTSAEVVWEQVYECLEWDWGRRYTPKTCKKLITFIDDLHNTECSSVCEFVRHHLSSGSVCDPRTNKWHSISDITYIVTSDPTSHVKLRQSFMKHFAVIHWQQYSSEELVGIFHMMLSKSIVQTPPTGADHIPIDDSTLLNLVETAVQVHRKLGSMFLPTPERLHYVFSVNNIATLFKKLCSVAVTDGHELVLSWQRESWWLYSGVLSSCLDRERYWEAVSHALNKYFNEDPMLVQYLDESSCRLPVKQLDEWRGRLTHELTEHNLSHSQIHINLYDSTVEEIHHLCHVINSPFDHGHMILLGHTHPEPLLQLASLHCGYMLVKPSQYFSQSLLTSSSQSGMSLGSYSIKQMRRDLLTIYTIAGVKNEKMVILLTDKEILDESFLTCVYEFIKGGAISPLFSKEEQAKIVNAVRSDMNQAGVAFTRQSGWQFFIRRVHSNVRLVLSLSSLRLTVRSGCHRWRDLFGSVQVYYRLPWERRELVSVATHHLRECDFLGAGQLESLAHLLASVHLQLRVTEGVFANNTDYHYYVERFVHELKELHSESQSKCCKLSSALACIEQATNKITTLQERKKRESIVLDEKCQACNKLLVQIGQDTAISHQHNKLVTKQRERIVHLKKVIPDYEHAYSVALRDKEDLISSLQSTVASMDHESLSELRALQRAPEEVEELLVAVIIIMKGPSADFSWTKGAKRLMANLDRFSELLLEFSSSEDNSEVLLESLDPLIEKPSFSPNSYQKQPVGGIAASQLCTWVMGVHRLHAKLQATLRPLQSRVTSMKASLAEYSDKLHHQENKVSVLDERLEGLSVSLENASVEKSRQRQLLNKMKKELKETNDFIQSLSGLDDHWRLELEDSSTAIASSVGALCLTVTMATYLAPLTPHQQMETINGQLVPLLDERGIQLCWRNDNNIINILHQVTHNGLPPPTATPEDHQPIPNINSHTGVLEISPVQTPILDSNSSKPLKDCSKQALSSSYTSCCACLQSLLVKEDFLDHWLASGCGSSSLAYLMPCSLLHAAWNRWPLVCDPHGFASRWIREYAGEELICIDGRDRSSKFFLTIEEAVVKGGKVLIEHFPSPMDPALLPVIEIGNSKEGAKIVQFCGHRLHVHPSFSLLLTTPLSPSSLSSSLASLVTIISFPTSLPLTEDILIATAFNMLTGREGEYMEASKGIAACKAELRSLEGEFFAKLPVDGKEICYWWSTEKISNIVTNKDQILKIMDGLVEKLTKCCVLRHSLLPLAKHAAMIYSILEQLESSNPLLAHSWAQFEDLFKKMLASLAKEQPTLSKDNASERVGVAIDRLNRAVLQDAIQYLDHHSWLLLASSMAVLSQCHLITSSNSLLLVEQLLYLSQGASYLQDLDTSLENEHQSIPACISQDLWQLLHKIPLSAEYFSVVISSIHDNPEFWESLGPVISDNLMELKELPPFPWKLENNLSSAQVSSLDEYVLLNCLRPQLVQDKLLALARPLVDSVEVPDLREIITGAEGSYPLLLVHSRENLVSQANEMELEGQLKKCLPGKSVCVVGVCAGVGERLNALLSRPNCDCVLVTDLHLAPQQWINSLTWRIRDASRSGCLLIFTTLIPLSETTSTTLPTDFIRSCRTISLSNITLTASAKTIIPTKQLWMSNINSSNNFYSLLMLCFANLPPSTMAQCDTLPDTLRPLLFNLGILHTAIVLTKSSETLINFERAHLSLFFRNIEEVLALALARHGTHHASRGDPVVILQMIRAHASQVYSCCLPRYKLKELVDACLSEEVTNPSGRVKLEGLGVEVSVPSQAVTVGMFQDHVEGIMDAAGQSENQQLIRFGDLVESIEAVLLPLLTQVPSPDLYNLAPPSSTSHTPNHTHHSTTRDHSASYRTAKATMDAIENCREEVPGRLEANEIVLGGSAGVKESLAKVMTTCSQLASSDSYLEHKKDKIVEEFNSVISTIKSDLTELMHYATIEFDGLPLSLQTVLASLRSNKMPLRWGLALPPGHQSTDSSINEGLKALKRLHSNLQLTAQ